MLLVSGLNSASSAQEMGLSFSYFLPARGDFSIPVTPFSIRGIGFDFNRFSGIETGGSIYRMSGMNIKDLPFESDEALAGPFFSVFVPLELILKADLGRHVFKLKGGGFGFINFGTKLHHGNIDRALRDHLEWEVLNSEFHVKNKPGYGYLFGAEYTLYINKSLGVSFEAQYLNGASNLDMKGEYRGIANSGGTVMQVDQEYPDAQLDYRGVEISIGVLISQ